MSSVAIADHRIGRSAAFAVIVAACLIALIGFGTRASFGLYLEPMTVANGWSRETFGLAMAIQNLLWGIGVPVAGAIADRYGPGLVIAVGTVIYGVGVAGMAVADSGLALHLTGGLLVGLGVAFTSFSLALAAIARVVSPRTPVACARLRHRRRLARPGALLAVLPGPDIELRVVRLAGPGVVHHPDHDSARVHPAGHQPGARRGALESDHGRGAGRGDDPSRLRAAHRRVLRVRVPRRVPHRALSRLRHRSRSSGARRRLRAIHRWTGQHRRARSWPASSDSGSARR